MMLCQLSRPAVIKIVTSSCADRLCRVVSSQTGTGNWLNVACIAKILDLQVTLAESQGGQPHKRRPKNNALEEQPHSRHGAEGHCQEAQKQILLIWLGYQTFEKRNTRRNPLLSPPASPAPGCVYCCLLCSCCLLPPRGFEAIGSDSSRIRVESS